MTFDDGRASEAQTIVAPPKHLLIEKSSKFCGISFVLGIPDPHPMDELKEEPNEITKLALVLFSS